MISRVMICARCLALKRWPRDFPKRTYAVCATCTIKQAAEHAHAAEREKQGDMYFVTVGAVLLVAIAATVAIVWGLT